VLLDTLPVSCLETEALSFVKLCFALVTVQELKIAPIINIKMIAVMM
jgi:hypothetical protein